MGDPSKRRKKFTSPNHPYQKERIESELIIIGKYGLRNKRELWRAFTKLGNYRSQARSLLALDKEEREKREKILIDKLMKLGMVTEGITSDDILGLDVEIILNRRLQTLVLKKGLAGTIHQARQLIVHRHIAVNGRIMTVPGYIVSLENEDLISYAPNSPFNDENHPMSASLQREADIVELPKKQERRPRR